jgi:hypothetical protein
VPVSMSNVSIEPRMADAALMLPSVEAGRNELKKKHEGRIIGGLDIGRLRSVTQVVGLRTIAAGLSDVAVQGTRSSVSFFQLPRMDEPSRSRDPFLGQAHRGQVWTCSY